MQLPHRLIPRLTRILGLLGLLLGLFDAGMLLGVGSGAASPLESLGVAGFTYLAIFTLGLLFGAVGLWILSSWGAIVLAGTLALHLVLALLGNPYVTLSLFGFLFRIVLLGMALALLLYDQLRNMDIVND